MVHNSVRKIVHYEAESGCFNYNRYMTPQLLNFTNVYHTRSNTSSWDSIDEDMMGENLAYGF